MVCTVRYQAGANDPAHGNARASLISIQAGHCFKQMGRREFSLARGSALFIPPEYIQKDRFPRTTTFLAVELAPSFLARYDDIGVRLTDTTSIDARDARDLSAKLLRELADSDAASPLVFEGTLLDALACAYRVGSAPLTKTRPPLWLLQARDYLHDRARESFRLQEVAAGIDVHPTQLSREFRRFFRVTPGEYVRQRRIDWACRQLTETDRSLTDIALAAGFADQAHFSRVFRRVMHMSPAQYVRQRVSLGVIGRRDLRASQLSSDHPIIRRWDGSGKQRHLGGP